MKRRKSGDLDFSDILTSGSWDGTGNFLRGVAPARPNVRTFDPEEAKKSTDKDFKKAMASMSSLTLWENLEPNSKLGCHNYSQITNHPQASNLPMRESYVIVYTALLLLLTHLDSMP